MDSQIAHDIYSVPRTQDVCLLENVSFKDMFFSEVLCKSLTENGFYKPSPIQYKAIPLARCGFDLIVQSKSGTGKTLVFVITALESLDLSINRVQAIILTPTREIALQVTDVFRAVGKEMKDLAVNTFIGGLPLAKDLEALKKCHVAVGAPGRIHQLVDLGYLKTEAVRLLILDEADQLMAKSFQCDINFIYWSLSEFKQMLALSATYPEELVAFLGNYMRSGKLVTPETDPVPVLRGLKQFVSLTRCHPNSFARLTDKENRLVSILTMIKFNQCIIFSNYQSRAESTCNMLRCRGWSCEWMSGRQPQEDRLKAMTELRSGRCRLLVTTDLTARGIDSKGINLVVNMDTPYDPRIYLHRMGRAGRYGSQGVVVTILSHGQDLDNFLKMLGLIGKDLSVKVVPSSGDYDLWSDDTCHFDELYGMEPEEITKQDSVSVVNVEPNKTNGSVKDKKHKKSKSTNNFENCENNINANHLTSLDLSSENISIVNESLPLNDYFLLENDSGEFLPLKSLQESLKEFEKVEKEEFPSLYGKKDAKGDRITVQRKSSFSDVLLSKTVKANEAEPPKVLKAINSQQIRKMSYSEVTKGRRTECKPVEANSGTCDGRGIKKSPLKSFPIEKVSNQIEGIQISEKAIDGFSKRMYPYVVQGNDRTNVSLNKETMAKKENKAAFNCDDISEKSTFTDSFSIVAANMSPIVLEPIHKQNKQNGLQFTFEAKLNGNKEKSIVEDIGTHSRKPSGKTIKNPKNRDLITNKCENIRSIESDNDRNDFCTASSPYHDSNSRDISSSINERSFYERQANLSKILKRKRTSKNRNIEVTFEDSSTSYSSDSEGEYIVSESVQNNSSHTNPHLSDKSKQPFAYIDWLKLYYHQTSVIYKYVKHTKDFHFTRRFY